MSSPDEQKVAYGKDSYNADESIPSSADYNPLASPFPWWYEFYKRIKLVPWWINYNFGIAREAVLKDKIVDLSCVMGLQDKWVKRILRHAVSEFTKKGLGPDYYGYHNIDHELEATYFTLLAAKGQIKDSVFSTEDLHYMFVAALFHDFDPMKQFDKPHEDSVEWFIRNDKRIQNFIKEAKLNINIVIAMIHRTAYPFTGENQQHARKRMAELFTLAKIQDHDEKTRRHYEELGWFLSVAERIAGYALGDFARSMELARRNAHALGWHSSVINTESVKYFSALKEEREMVDRVLGGVPDEYRKRFWDNVAGFNNQWQMEVLIKTSIRRKEVTLMPVVEKIFSEPDARLKEAILRLYRELPPPIRVEEERFHKSLRSVDTLLVTLRVNSNDGMIVGYAKGGPLERYKLRRGTDDMKIEERNTIYLEAMSIAPGYWGGTGGHLLRRQFLNEAKNRGYEFVTAYAHRNVIKHRIGRGEKIEIVQKYDPDKFDYYRQSLEELPVTDFLASPIIAASSESLYEAQAV
ncbi:MAG: hypothetical protein ACE5J2_03165 [Nitrososphaerales archaeon]